MFARLGFARATIDLIAAEANVSTRTLYKHFHNKDELFATVLTASATAVADDYERAVRSGISSAHTPHERLKVLALAATKQALGHPEHFAMIRQIVTETQHFPQGVIDAWRKAGPDRVQRETITQLRALHKDGVLEIENFARAARHFFALTSAETTERPGRARPSPRAVEDAIDAAVQVFERGYAPRRA